MNQDRSHGLREEVGRVLYNIEIEFAFLRNLLEQGFSPSHVGLITLLQLVQLVLLSLSLFLGFQFLIRFWYKVLGNVTFFSHVLNMISHEMLGEFF